jgi:transposase
MHRLIEKTKLLLGMKGYYTNINSAILSNQDIIDRYHDLWHVEQAFRIAKSDLASRPVFHHKNQAVRSHILICFTALMLSKYLEIKTKLPIRQVIDSIWNVTEAKLFNKVTSTTIFLQSEITTKPKTLLTC